MCSGEIGVTLISCASLYESSRDKFNALLFVISSIADFYYGVATAIVSSPFNGPGQWQRELLIV